MRPVSLTTLALSSCFLRVQNAPKLKVAIVGSGLAGMSTAVELLDQGYEVDVYEQRPFIGGKVASYRDRDGNHVEMGYVVHAKVYQSGTLFMLTITSDP